MTQADTAKEELENNLKLQMLLLEKVLKDSGFGDLKTAIVVWHPDDADTWVVLLGTGVNLSEVSAVIKRTEKRR